MDEDDELLDLILNEGYQGFKGEGRNGAKCLIVDQDAGHNDDRVRSQFCILVIDACMPALRWLWCRISSRIPRGIDTCPLL